MKAHCDLRVCFVLSGPAKAHIHDVPTDFKDDIVLRVTGLPNLIRLKLETWTGGLCKYHKHEHDTQQPVAEGAALPSTSGTT